MTPQEIIREIQKLPVSAQAEVRQSLLEYSDANGSAKIKKPLTEEEYAKYLLAKGVIRKIPDRLTDEEDDFEPSEFSGEPVSETIIRERR